MCEKLSAQIWIYLGGGGKSILGCQKMKRCILNNDFHVPAFESLSQNHYNGSAIKWGGGGTNVISEDSVSQT